MNEETSKNESCASCDCGKENRTCSCGKKCGCPHHSMLPALAILFALNFLLGTLGVYSAYVVGIIWPIIIILVAGKMLVGGKCKCC